MTVEIVIKVLQKYLKNSSTCECKNGRDQADSAGTSGTSGLDFATEYAKIKDSSKVAISVLILTDDEMKIYKARKQLCWEAEDPLKFKQELYNEYVTIAED